jgi:glycerol-3-phosphate dehydrogenase
MYIFCSLAFLSGPSFAAEVGQGQPTAVTIASAHETIAIEVQEIMSTVRFRCYTSQDVVGVEFGGALKNVLAIACGISDGLGFGCNARAALMTRGTKIACMFAMTLHSLLFFFMQGLMNCRDWQVCLPFKCLNLGNLFFMYFRCS